MVGLEGAGTLTNRAASWGGSGKISAEKTERVPAPCKTRPPQASRLQRNTQAWILTYEGLEALTLLQASHKPRSWCCLEPGGKLSQQ